MFHSYPIWTILSIVVVVLGLGACTTLSDEERLWRRGIDAENWEMCVLAYSKSNMYTFHSEHRHGPYDTVRPYDIKSDLNNNSCERVLRDYWIEY